MPLEFTTVTKADEIPTDISPGIENWSENYCWHGYDRATHTGVFIQFGRWVRNPTIWREQLQFFFPDGAVGTYRGYGREYSEDGPAGPLIKAVVDIDSGDWTMTFTGPVSMSTSKDLLKGRLIDEPAEELSFDLVFKDTTPILKYPETKGESWGSSHYEAAGIANGRLRSTSQDATLTDGFAYRDHSRGPRNLSHHVGSIWMQGKMPDGSLFCIYEILQERDGEEYQAMAEATLVTADGPRTVELTRRVPRLAPGSNDPTASFTIAFEVEGDETIVEAQAMNNVPFSLSNRFDWCFGWSGGPIYGLEQPLKLTINGAITDGYLERSIRHPLLNGIGQ